MYVHTRRKILEITIFIVNRAALSAVIKYKCASAPCWVQTLLGLPVNPAQGRLGPTRCISVHLCFIRTCGSQVRACDDGERAAHHDHAGGSWVMMMV